MMKKAIKYILIVLVIGLAAQLTFNPSFRDSVVDTWYSLVLRDVDKLNYSVDRGDRALAVFDQQYKTASQKLVSLKALRDDSAMRIKQRKEQVDSSRKQGKEDLALRYEEQVSFYEKQLQNYDISIQKRTEKLIELNKKRELARADVEMARERINTLRATRDAMSQEDAYALMNEAKGYIDSLQMHSNELTAGIEVLMMED